MMPVTKEALKSGLSTIRSGREGRKPPLAQTNQLKCLQQPARCVLGDCIRQAQPCAVDCKLHCMLCYLNYMSSMETFVAVH